MKAQLRIEVNQIKGPIKQLWQICIPQVAAVNDVVVRWKTLSRTFLKLGFTGFGFAH